MTRTTTALGLALGLMAAAGPATPQEARSKAPDVGKTYRVPYRNTDTNHALVRVRINGKGPFNFLVDTGAPLLYIGTEAAKKVGLEPSKTGFYTDVDRVDFEGGPFLTNVKARVEDPFQLVGMNALGLPGASIDGILGYSILSRYRFTLDPTTDRMAWTRLDFDPPDLDAPADARAKAAAAAPEVEAMSLLGPLMKFASIFVGKKPEDRLVPRGGLGLELAEEGGALKVAAVLTGSPAETAGVKAGDVIRQIHGREVADFRAAREAVARVEPGTTVALIVRRDGADKDFTLTAADGL